jgi:hypothetical protein
MHFGENQLSPRSFGISPLPTAPLTVLQHGTVRASTPRYGRFTLAMGSSRGFGSAARHHGRPLQTRFRSATGAQPLRLKRRCSNSPVHSSIGTPSGRLTCVRPCPLTARQRTVSGSLSLPSPGFFSPFPHGTLRYRSRQLFSLGTWSSLLPTRFLVPGGTRDRGPRSVGVGYGALTRSGGPSQGPSPADRFAHSGGGPAAPPPPSLNPRRA